MIRLIPLLLLASVASASDVMHVPLLCKHWKESHAVAGSLVGLGMDAYLKEVSPLRPIPRALIAIGTALLVGTFKEHCVDHHPRNREIFPWAAGAACACIGFEIRF